MGPPTTIILKDDADTLGIFDWNRSKQTAQPQYILSVAFDYNFKSHGLTTSVTTNLEYKGVENRVTNNHGGPGNFIHVSFAQLCHAAFGQKDVNVDKMIEQILLSGIVVQNRDQIQMFVFCGHSNSQLKSRSCFFYKAKTSDVVTGMINSFGKFSDIKTIEKYAKRIGLLFSKSICDEQVAPERIFDIPDVERNGHIFTDGCGIISESFAKSLRDKIGKKNDLPPNYIPSVFQIRYKGYKGILMVASEEIIQDYVAEQVEYQQRRRFFNFFRFFSADSLPFLNNNGDSKDVLFRKSMKKFEGCLDNTLAILEYSKPSFAGALNTEIVNLLSSNGIPNEVFLEKQRQYMKYIRSVDYENKESMIGFLKLMRRFDLIENLEKQYDKKHIPAWIQSKVQQLKREELFKCFDVDKMARIHIQNSDSRLLLGVCDFSGRLLPGQCYVRVTSTDLKRSIAITGNVIVTRNPCLFPGDIQHFDAQEDIPELAHLLDCIVFSVKGDMPAASTLSGGDLDGDKFFVCWDSDLIKMEKKVALDYSQLAPNTSIVPSISWEMRIDYFAYYSTSLGQIMSLYWKWVNAYPNLRSNSVECKELSKLYARCVDGEKVKIPKKLKKPPIRADGVEILKLLKQNVRDVSEGKDFAAFLDVESEKKQIELNIQHSFVRDPFENETLKTKEDGRHVVFQCIIGILLVVWWPCRIVGLTLLWIIRALFWCILLLASGLERIGKWMTLTLFRKLRKAVFAEKTGRSQGRQSRSFHKGGRVMNREKHSTKKIFSNVWKFGVQVITTFGMVVAFLLCIIFVKEF